MKKVMMSIRNPPGLRYVRIETRTLYDGDPFRLIDRVLWEIFECDRSSADARTFQVRCTAILLHWNPEIKRFGLQFKLRKGYPSGRVDGRRFAVRFKRSAREDRNGTMLDKYGDIQICRIPESEARSIWSSLQRRNVAPDGIQRYLNQKRKPYRGNLRRSYSDLVVFLNWWRKELKDLDRRDPLNAGAFLLSSGFGEIANVLVASYLEANNGFFRSALKELRDAVEWIALTVFLDCLRMRYQIAGINPFPEVYHEMIETGDWHKASENQIRLGIIRSPEELKKGIERRLFRPNKDQLATLGIAREVFIESALTHMSLPLYIVSTSSILCPRHVMVEKYSLGIGSIEEYVKLEFARIIAVASEKRDYQPWLRKSDYKPLEEKYRGLQLEVPTNCEHDVDGEACGEDAGMATQLSPRLPSVNVLIYMAGKRLGLAGSLVSELLSKYDDYCCIVHPYPQTMQYSPFTSRDELDLWHEELTDLSYLLSNVLCKLVTFVRGNSDETCLSNQEKICGRCSYLDSGFRKLDWDAITKKRWKKNRVYAPIASST